MNRNTFLLLLLTLFFVGCSDDYLNQPPLDRITDSDVWRDQALMDAYIYKIYDDMPWDYLNPDYSRHGVEIKF